MYRRGAPVSLLIAAVLTAAMACASGPGPFRGSSLSRISIGMPKAEVVRLIGEPKGAGARQNTEVFHYVEDKGWWQFDYYYVRFVDGKVESYGPESKGQPVN